MSQITVGFDGRIWGVGPSSKIWTREGINGKWQVIDEVVSQIAVGIDNRLWATQVNGPIKTCKLDINRVWGINTNN